jgi:putative ABC transport system permease protein
VKILARASARYFGRHRAQMVLSVVGVALGVGVVLAIDLATESARAGFRISAETISGRATHQITHEAGLLDDALLTRLRTELGLRAAAPVLEGFASSSLLPGQALRILGVDPFSESPFRGFVSGGAEGFGAVVGGEPAPVDLGRFLTTRGGIVMSSATAARAGLVTGDTLPVLVGGQSWELPVVGTLDAVDRLTQAGLSDVLLMDISGAQDVLGAVGRLSRIDLALPDTPESDETLRRVAAMLAPGQIVTPAGTRAETMAGMIDAFGVNLAALSLLALVFGMFLIYNSVTFSVVQRRDLLGRLRTIGVTRGEILRLILREALWIGVVGSAIGVGVGTLLARGLVRLVTRTINDLYFTVSVEGVALDPLLLAKAAGLGLAATLLAALAPALEAARAEPRLTTLRSIAEARVRTLVPRAATLGAALALIGWAMLELPAQTLALGFSGLFVVVAGLSLLTPAGTVLLVRLARPVLHRVGGTIGLVAARGVVSSLTRTAPAITALVVAVSVTVGLGVMIQSFRGTLVRWLDATLLADVYVSLPGPRASVASGTLWPDLVERFVAHPDVVAHSTYRGVDLVDGNGAYRLVALDLDPRGEGAFDFLSGDTQDLIARFRRGDGVVVSEPFAYHRAVAMGDEISLPTPVGSRRVAILGVFRDYGSDQGTVMLSRTLYDRYYDDPGVTSLALFLSPGADSERVVAELLAGVPEGRSVIARTNDVLRFASLDVFDRTFEVTAVLRLLAFIVAFVGVLSALMALELERSRELGVLRAWGVTPGEVWKLVLTQTGLLGLIAGVLAVPMGIVLSTVMIFVVNKRSFGWTLEMQLGLGVPAQAIALALVGALVAGLYPAWRMSRASPALALRGE